MGLTTVLVAVAVIIVVLVGLIFLVKSYSAPEKVLSITKEME